MGYRLHNRTVNKIEYGTGVFNHCCEQINLLIEELCPKAYFNDEETNFASKIEIDKEELKNAIETVKNNIQHFEWLLESKAINYTAREFVDILEGWLNTSDKESGFITLDWF